jgi:hypothetical protein
MSEDIPKVRPINLIPVETGPKLVKSIEVLFQSDKDYFGEHWESRFLEQLRFDVIKTAVIEYPYVDQEFTSCYYGLYIRRHGYIPKYCIRIHFFSCEIKSVMELSEKRQPDYLGFTVIRPIGGKKNVSKTFLSARALRGTEGSRHCYATYSANLFGIKFEVDSFPFMSQDGELSRCAHASSWMLHRHFSQLFPHYQELRLFELIELANEPLTTRSVPSRGLTADQCLILQKRCGFYPEVVSKQVDGKDDIPRFQKILFTYLDSNLPVIGAIKDTGRNRGHAMCLVGLGKDIPDKHLCFQANKPFQFPTETVLVHDDNFLPMKPIPIEKIEDDGEYGLENLDFIIVPLTEKLYLNAQKVFHVFDRIYSRNLTNLKQKIPKDKLWWKAYVTRGATLRAKLRTMDSRFQSLKKHLMVRPLPKYVWVIEGGHVSHTKEGKVNFRWVIDSTARPEELSPWIFLHDFEKSIFNDRRLQTTIRTTKIDLDSKLKRLTLDNFQFDGLSTSMKVVQ